MQELGQIGYEAYAASTGGKTFDGRPMPTWAQVKERTPHVAKAWNDAALGISGALSASVSGPDARFPFSVAIEHLKAGRRVARAGWNGKAMWIALTPGDRTYPAETPSGAAQHLLREHEATPTFKQPHFITVGAHIDMRAADGSLVIGWLASQTDMLAEDWMVLP